MAYRTNTILVSQIIEVDNALSVEPFIATANNLVNWLSSKDTASLLSASTLELIERWLAAHFYAQRDQQYQQKATGRANATFQGQTSMGLQSTYWGQQALILDTTGFLAQRSQEAISGMRRSARVMHLGAPDCDDYVNEEESSYTPANDSSSQS